MLAEFHSSLKTLLLERGDIPADEVDIDFELPNQEWMESVVRPTINLHFFHLQENTELRRTNLETTRTPVRATTRLPARRFDLHFMVTAVSSVVADQQTLLWRTLTTLLKYPQYPTELLPAQIRETLTTPLQGRLGAEGEGPSVLDIWSALRVPPRPTLHYVFTVPLDVDQGTTAPLVLTRTTRLQPHGAGEGGAQRHTIGGTIHKDGVPAAGAHVQRAGSATPYVTDEQGRFVMPGLPDGTTHLTITCQDGTRHDVTLTVPAQQYDLTLT